MTTQTDRIERDVLIAAPVDRVWELITSPEHLGTWFGETGAEVDLRPGGTLTVSWREYPAVHGRVEAVEPPHRFAWRWLTATAAGADATPANSTLVEFTLAAEGEGTRVALVESGFGALDVDAEAREALVGSHSRGWPMELDELAAHAAGAVEAR